MRRWLTSYTGSRRIPSNEAVIWILLISKIGDADSTHYGHLSNTFLLIAKDCFHNCNPKKNKSRGIRPIYKGYMYHLPCPSVTELKARNINLVSFSDLEGESDMLCTRFLLSRFSEAEWRQLEKCLPLSPSHGVIVSIFPAIPVIFPGHCDVHHYVIMSFLFLETTTTHTWTNSQGIVKGMIRRATQVCNSCQAVSINRSSNEPFANCDECCWLSPGSSIFRSSFQLQRIMFEFGGKRGQVQWDQVNSVNRIGYQRTGEKAEQKRR